jgi:hypothetical protein
LSNLIETAALRRVREEQFVDDAEMAEIRANEALLERMRAGSQQARERKGCAPAAIADSSRQVTASATSGTSPVTRWRWR